MKHKAILLSSVSAVAASAAAVGGAHAAGMPAVTGYTYSVQGSAIFSPGPSSAVIDEDAANKISDGFTGVVVQDHPGDAGYAGATTFGVQFNGGWDATFGLSANEFVTNTASVQGNYNFGFSGGSGSFSGTSTLKTTEKTVFGFETADAEIGFTPVMSDGFNVRLFGGVRVLHFHSSDEFQTTSSFTGNGFTIGGSSIAESGTFNFNSGISSDFLGAGPRVGISASKRFDGSNFGISGSLAAAAIFGQQTDTSSFSFSSSFSSSINGGPTSTRGSGSSFSSSHTYSKTVFDLQAQVGVDYYLNDATKLTVGYQVEELTNVGIGADSNVNKTTQGAFVKVSGSFN